MVHCFFLNFDFHTRTTRFDQRNKKNLSHRIYSINHPGCLFNFGPMRVAPYLRWALIIFPTFSASEAKANINKP